MKFISHLLKRSSENRFYNLMANIRIAMIAVTRLLFANMNNCILYDT